MNTFKHWQIKLSKNSISRTWNPYVALVIRWRKIHGSTQILHPDWRQTCMSWDDPLLASAPLIWNRLCFEGSSCRWGFVVAEGLSGKGSGSRSLLHKLKTGCLMHDASYHAVFQMSASLNDMFRLLSEMRYANVLFKPGKICCCAMALHQAFEWPSHNGWIFPCGEVYIRSQRCCNWHEQPL